LHDYAFVAAGAVVTKDVPAYAIVSGVPATITGWMSACGDVLEFDEDGIAMDSMQTKYQQRSPDKAYRVT